MLKRKCFNRPIMPPKKPRKNGEQVRVQWTVHAVDDEDVITRVVFTIGNTTETREEVDPVVPMAMFAHTLDEDLEHHQCIVLL
jgi:hypothetical protein